MDKKVWVFTKLGEEKWKNSRLPQYRDDSHNEGKEVPEIDHQYCESWAKNGWVELITVTE